MPPAKEFRLCGRSTSLPHRCSLRRSRLWYVSVYSSAIYGGKNSEHLYDDNHSYGLALDYFSVGKSGFCYPQAQKPHFNVVFFFASWTALLCNIALWHWTASCQISFQKVKPRIPYTFGASTHQAEIQKKNTTRPNCRQVFCFLIFFNSFFFLIESRKSSQLLLCNMAF